MNINLLSSRSFLDQEEPCLKAWRTSWISNSPSLEHSKMATYFFVTSPLENVSGPHYRTRKNPLWSSALAALASDPHASILLYNPDHDRDSYPQRLSPDRLLYRKREN